VRDKDLKREHRALFISVSTSDLQGVTSNAQVLDNKFIGPGHSHLVEFQRPGNNEGLDKIIFSNNYCEHFNAETDNKSHSTATFWTRRPGNNPGSLVVVGNQITQIATRVPIQSIDLNGQNQATVVSNSVKGSIVGANNPVPAPLEKFNVIL
jgi:hypothetical protein